MFFRKRLLLIYVAEPGSTPQAVYDHINQLTKMPGFKVNTFNSNYRLSQNTPERKIALDKYDGIIIHNTVSYSADYVYDINSRFHPTLDKFTGFKVLMKQDEMLSVNKTIRLLKEFNFNLLLTCVSPKNFDKVYSKIELPKLEKMHVLTGYVTSKMKKISSPPQESRPMDIVYRGMKCPYNFGKLSYEKYEIGEKFKRVCQERQLKSDISSEIQDRIYGKKWFQFLSNSKATLGVESGASIFDFTGEIESMTNLYLKQKPNVSFDEVYDSYLKYYDGKIDYNTVSPRHFESAATRTVQILYEGDYEHIFKPNIHYIPLKKDFSNIEEVLVQVADVNYRLYLTSMAHKEIILNEEYSFKNFINTVGATIRNLM